MINHKLTPKELDDKLGKGWKELPEQVYKKLTFHPASFEVEEHHVGVYAGKDDTIIRAPHPKNLLDKSLVTPSLAAGIFNYKFVRPYVSYLSRYTLKRDSRPQLFGMISKQNSRPPHVVFRSQPAYTGDAASTSAHIRGQGSLCGGPRCI